MDHPDLRRAQSSGQEGHGVHVCHKCGWPFPNPHPGAKNRRAHKKICGTVDGYKVVASQQLSVSDGEQNNSDNEDPKTPSPKVAEKSLFEKGSGRIKQGSMQSDDGVFSDAVAEFSDSGSAAAWSAEGGPVVERGDKKDLNAVLFQSEGGTTGTGTSEDLKKTNVTDSTIENGLTSINLEAEVTRIPATNLDRNISSETSSMSDSRTEEPNDLNGSNGLHPIQYEMATDASEAIERICDTDSMIDSCLTSVDQGAEVSGITAINLDRNMILPNKVASETVEGGSKLEGLNEMTSEYVRDDEDVPSKGHSHGSDMHIPCSDVPLEVESLAHGNPSVDTAEKVDTTDEIQHLNSGIESHNGTEEENANVHVVSVPDGLNVVEDPVLMLEDFRNHQGKQLDRFTSCLDSWEQFDDKGNDIKQPVFNENMNNLQSSDLGGGTVVSSDIRNLEASLEPDDSSSKPMVKSVPVEGEVDMSQYEMKMFKNQSSDEIESPAEGVLPHIANTYEVVFPEGPKSNDNSNETFNMAASDAVIGQNTPSVGPDVIENYGDCDGRGESGNDSRNGPAEENLVENPIATAQPVDCYESQILPAAKVHIDDELGYEKGVIEKCNKIGDAGYNEKAETFHLCGDDKNKGATEKFSRDPASNLESDSCLPELQYNPVTNLHEGGDAVVDYEKDKTKNCDLIGYDGDLEKAEKHVPSDEDLSRTCKDKTFVEDPASTFESVITLSDSQVHPAKKLPDVDDSEKLEKFDEGEIEKFVITGNERVDGSLEENILVKSELTPDGVVEDADGVVEDATDGLELVETRNRVVDVSSNSRKVSGNILLDTSQELLENEIACNDKIQKEVDPGAAAVSDHGQNAESFQKSLEDQGIKEPGFSAPNTESSVQSFIASHDSVPQEVHAVVSGITAQSLLEEGDDNLVKQQPSPTAIDMDSNSQTDSLEANWGSFSVLSMQSDAVTDAEVLPHTHSQASLEENSDLKKSKSETESRYSDKSDMFEAPSFMTLVEPRGAEDQKPTGSETLTAVQNPEQPKPASLQTGWFPSMTHVVNESQGRKKNEEIITKVTNWSTGKHTPLKSLLGEASSESKGKPQNQKESPAPAPQIDDKAAKVSGPVTTLNSILNPESPPDQAAKKEHAKEWNSPARYPSDTKRDKRKVKGRSWVQFVCCASVN